MRLPIRLVVVLSVLLGGSALAAGDAAAAKARFASGRELIRDNVGDSYGATKEALLRGIAELREALRLGYSPGARAYWLIAEGYGGLQSLSKPGSAERAGYARAELDALENVMRLDSSDLKVRLYYATRVEDVDAALRAYDEVLARDSTRGDVLYSSGEMLVRAGRVEQGLNRIERAANMMSPTEAQRYGPLIVDMLENNGREKRAVYWRPILEKRAEAAKGQQ